MGKHPQTEVTDSHSYQCDVQLTDLKSVSISISELFLVSSEWRDRDRRCFSCSPSVFISGFTSLFFPLAFIFMPKEWMASNDPSVDKLWLELVSSFGFRFWFVGKMWFVQVTFIQNWTSWLLRCELVMKPQGHGEEKNKLFPFLLSLYTQWNTVI